MLKKVFSWFLALCFLLEQPTFLMASGNVNVASAPVGVSRVGSLNTLDLLNFRPVHLRSLIYNNTANTFNIFVDKGSIKDLQAQELDSTTSSLMEYFWIGMSLPNDAFWVNLKPDAKNNIIDQRLSKTDLGKVLLEADLELKKDTAKYMSPINSLGQQYWTKLYQKAGEIFGNQKVNVPTLIRPWIVPGEVIVSENRSGPYIYKATMKVMLEEDRLAGSNVYNFNDAKNKELNQYAAVLAREIIIPQLTKDINSNAKYASLRQVFYSLILAQWFKEKYSNSRLSSNMNTGNLDGLTSKLNWDKMKYFDAYTASFKSGEYNVKQQINVGESQVIRNYVTGGILFDKIVSLKMPSFSSKFFNYISEYISSAIPGSFISRVGNYTRSKAVVLLKETDGGDYDWKDLTKEEEILLKEFFSFYPVKINRPLAIQDIKAVINATPADILASMREALSYRDKIAINSILPKAKLLEFEILANQKNIKKQTEKDFLTKAITPLVASGLSSAIVPQVDRSSMDSNTDNSLVDKGKDIKAILNDLSFPFDANAPPVDIKTVLPKAEQEAIEYAEREADLYRLIEESKQYGLNPNEPENFESIAEKVSGAKIDDKPIATDQLEPAPVDVLTGSYFPLTKEERQEFIGKIKAIFDTAVNLKMKYNQWVNDSIVKIIRSYGRFTENDKYILKQQLGKAFDNYSLMSQEESDKFFNAAIGLPGFYQRISSQEAIELRKQAVQLVVDGKFVAHLNQGGSATRLGLGAMYFVRLKEVAKLFLDLQTNAFDNTKKEEIKAALTKYFGEKKWDEAKIAQYLNELKEVYEQLDPNLEDIGMGPMQILGYRMNLKKFAQDHGLDEARLMEKVKIVVHVNDEILQDVANDLAKNGYYGFKKENVYMLSDRMFHGFILDKAYKLILDMASLLLAPGHGYAYEQFGRKNQTFIFDSDGVLQQKSDSLLEILNSKGVEILRTMRINDPTMWTADALSIDRIGYFIYQVKNKNVVIANEMFANPDRQKGGSWVKFKNMLRAFLVETLALKVDRLKEISDWGATYGTPTNAMRTMCSVPGLQEIFSKHRLPKYFRVKEKRFYTEMVSGDVNMLPGTNSVAFLNKVDEAIPDFKEFGNLARGLRFLKEFEMFLGVMTKSSVARNTVLSKDKISIIKQREQIVVNSLANEKLVNFVAKLNKGMVTQLVDIIRTEYVLDKKIEDIDAQVLNKIIIYYSMPASSVTLSSPEAYRLISKALNADRSLKFGDVAIDGFIFDNGMKNIGTFRQYFEALQMQLSISEIKSDNVLKNVIENFVAQNKENYKLKSTVQEVVLAVRGLYGNTKLGELSLDNIARVDGDGGSAEARHIASLSDGGSAKNKKSRDFGGIDFTSMFGPSLLSNGVVCKMNANINFGLNLNKEWKQLDNMLNQGLVPSKNRIEQYLVVGNARGEFLDTKENVLDCVARVLRDEEMKVKETDPQLKFILALVN